MLHDSIPISSLPLPLLLLDTEGRIVNANMAAQEQLGASAAKLMGLHLTKLFAPESAVENVLERVRGQLESISDHSLSHRISSQPFSLHISASDTGLAAILLPEINRHEVEQQSRRQEMAEAVARIALEMAHEVKNPLAALRGAAQWLAEHSTSEDTGDTTRHILAEVDRIRERIDAFLQLGPRANVDMTAINIHTILDEVSIADRGILIRRVYDPSLPEILAHPARLRQAFENLWRNALEADGSYIEWQTRVAATAQLPKHNGPVMEVSITNDGAPIPGDLHARLFEPYMTNKQRGSGLGLAIVERVMLEHDGRVQVSSEQGRTRFTLHLPIRNPS
ncbi:MAG: nitrogen regulation protein NR(II) [Mariprofundaceae bacterium]